MSDVLKQHFNNIFEELLQKIKDEPNSDNAREWMWEHIKFFIDS